MPIMHQETFQEQCDKIYKDNLLKKTKNSYTLEEVLVLLEEQKRLTCFCLGLSSRPYSYPSQYNEIVDWMMRAPLVIQNKQE